MTEEIVPGTLSDPLYVKSERIRVLFCQLKRERTGVASAHRRLNDYTDKGSRKRFYEVATFCQREGWDVDLYVRTAFDIIRRNHNYIMPVDLTHEAVSGAFAVKEITHTLQNDPRLRYNMQVRELLAYLQNQTSLPTETAILCSPMTPFDAWFRVLYPEHVDAKIMELYGTYAHQELSEDLPLRRFARARFPRGVKEIEQRLGGFGDQIGVS